MIFDRAIGTVKWFDEKKGFGFITGEDGDDVFVHYSDLQQDGFKKLEKDQPVEFTIINTDKGLHAEDVIAL